MPAWLIIASLIDLKASLVNVVIVLGIALLGQLVTWDGMQNLLPFEVAIAVVIVALSLFGALSLTCHTPPSRMATGNEEGEVADVDGAADANV